MSKFKIGDKVRGTQASPFIDKEMGIVRVIKCNAFGVEFKKYHAVMHTLDGRCEDGHGWWVEESDIELVESVVPTLAEIKEKEIDCLIHTRTQRDADILFIKLEPDGMWSADKCWTPYGNNTAYHIEDGKIHAYSDISWYKTNPPYSELPIYEFDDIYNESELGLVSKSDTKWEFVVPFAQIDKSADIARAVVDKMSTMGCRTFTVDKKALENIKNKENEIMRNTFTFTKGERTAIVVDTIEHKDKKNNTILEKKTREVKIPTITTTAKTINGTGSTTCDKEDFNERTGCLVASAKIIANKSEETNLMYQIAIKSWGESICTTILETLANKAVVGDFNTTYKKWKKEVADYDKEQRTCKVCHKVYDTIDEARKCEQAHAQRKVDKLNKYLERKHAMRMAKERLEKERKEQLIKDAMDKLTSEDKDNK
ncbi:MAG: hypothetical protein BWY47_00076 [Bacteroidetes bacterium ADurb.Bin302]|nr:MAG: hypothetical protein BWY47_00076 [Bacteroidetes bacterium ADurb.Bin302]